MTTTKIEFVARGLVIPLAELYVSPDNPRAGQGSEQLAELAGSIRELGQLVPLVVRARIGAPGYDVLAGSRRLCALEHAGESVATCDLVPMHVDAATVAAAENLERSALSFAEELDLVAGLLRRRGVKAAEDVAIALGRPTRWARVRLSCLALVPEARAQVEAGRLTLDGAAALAAFPAHVQPRIVERLAAYGEAKALDRHAVLWAADRARRALTLATWELDSVGGTRGIACSRCPARSDAQPDLFGDDTDRQAECLDPDCWTAKQSEAFGAALAAHEASGGVVLAKLDPDFVRLDDTARFGAHHSGVERKGARLSWRGVLGTKIDPSKVALVCVDGGPVYCYPRKDAERLAKKAFPDPKPKAAAPVDPSKPRTWWELSGALRDKVEARAWSAIVALSPPPLATLLDLLFATLESGEGAYLEGDGFADALALLPAQDRGHERKLQALLVSGLISDLRFSVDVDATEAFGGIPRELAVAIGVEPDDFVAVTWATWITESLDAMNATPEERAAIGL
jgi:ParB/RepB/Spo0J family partition protein